MNISILESNKELEKEIEMIIKQDTPEKEVFFQHGQTEEDNFVFKALTKDSKDDLLMELKRKNLAVSADINTIERAKNAFLEELRDELKGQKETVHRFLVEWKDNHKDKHRTSHFFGKDMNEVFKKIKGSVKDMNDIFIFKIELIPES